MSSKLKPCMHCGAKIATSYAYDVKICPKCQKALPSRPECCICNRLLFGGEIEIIDGGGYHSICIQKLYNFPLRLNCRLCKMHVADASDVKELKELVKYPCKNCGCRDPLFKDMATCNHFCYQCSFPILAYQKQISRTEYSSWRKKDEWKSYHCRCERSSSGGCFSVFIVIALTLRFAFGHIVS